MAVPLLLGALGVVAAAAASRAAKRSARRDRYFVARDVERKICASRGQRHRGGPGEPDCGHSTEIKHWLRRVDAYTVQREFDAGRRELIAPHGFTAGALRRGRELGMRLRRL
jgi:hypothetical protein